MPAARTIESINRDQLATASDRLLLRGRVWNHRPARSVAPPARGSSPAIPRATLAEGSRPRIVLPARRTLHPAPPARASQPLAMWPPVAPPAPAPAPACRGAMPPAVAAMLAIPTLVGFAIGLAAVL